MKTKIFSLLLIFSLLTFTNCKEKSDSELLLNTLEDNSINISDITNSIFILTDNECINCNKKFSKLLQDEIDNPKSVIIINSSGLLYDISSFKNKKNVIIIKSDNKIFNTTKIIKVKNKAIIKETVITADNINDLKL